MALNLEKQLLFYSSYHHDPTNIAIHITCIPILLMTGLLLATNSPSLVVLPSWLMIPNLPPNLATIVTIIFSSFYVMMEPVAGGFLLPLLYAWTAYAKHITSAYGSTANYVAVALHIGSWIAQFIGHGVFEGRKPALLDNLVQAILLAPFFVWMEVLFYFGYRPELKSRLDMATELEVEKLRKSKLQANGAASNRMTKS
ncbi:hypothetical protein MMC11_000550 [Xylographa trunciseda]|nr:hypothetical protein [Xylographa trunciseda]